MNTENYQVFVNLNTIVLIKCKSKINNFFAIIKLGTILPTYMNIYFTVNKHQVVSPKDRLFISNHRKI